MHAIGVHSFLKYIFYQDPDPARHLYPGFMPHLLDKVRARFFSAATWVEVPIEKIKNMSKVPELHFCSVL